jgi:hypothetical protein
MIVLGFLLAPASQAAGKPIPQTIDFNRDIRPILSENCYFCHGPDHNKRKADLRFDTHDGLFSTIKDNHVVVPGHPEQSEIYTRVIEPDPNERMPDPKSNKRLSDRQIALLKKWIEQGATWKGHWAYLEPTRPALPPVNDPAFAKNPIDRFILEGLKGAGLAHAPEADRVTLIRRLSFDLIGLPPTQAEVNAFVNDAAPDAYERLVDRLLASPHFGERMAVPWLDLVRYADSIGYHSDNPMNVWPYRDYVINAFNRNMPFDQFTREQLAGDLLPNATDQTRIASCYNRLIESTEEGGAQPKEYTAKYEEDRVRNVSTVWMGATMACCQCHDHKFDPYSQKDFYSMAAFFADIQEAAVGRREPGMPVLNDQQSHELKQIDQQIADAKKKLDAETPELAAAQAQWEKHGREQAMWTVVNPKDATVSGKSQLRKNPDGTLRDISKVAARETFHVTAQTDIKGITGFRLEVLDDPELPAHGPGTAPNGNFVLTAFKVTAESIVTGGGKPSSVKIIGVSADHSQDGYPIESLIDAAKGAGWAILPQTGKPHAAVFETAEPLNGEGGFLLTFTLEFKSQFPQHDIGHFRLSVTTASNPSAGSLPGDVVAALGVAASLRNAQQIKTLADYYRKIAPELRPLRSQMVSLEKQKTDLLAGAPTCLVSISGPPREVRLLHRGNWQDESGEIESPAVPHFLPQPPPGKDRLTRLDLANWLVAPNNPLTARVCVNRLWKQYFGTGISKSLGDLGSQGESPVNPELLDWLAMEFMHPSADSAPAAKPWDVKHIVRLIVTSGAYRQSSVAAPQDRPIDPFNRLCSHQSRFRLDAETVRDNALQISGLLSLKMGGPSAKPYQPVGYWDALNFPTRTYEADKGENQYRRGVYTWWQRTFLHPSLAAFDAPSREESTCERNNSNIPQQALVLLDDPTYVEAARVFAARIVHEGGAAPADRIDWAFQTALNRKPRSQEAQLLSDLYQKHLDEYSKDPASAQKLVETGQAPVPRDVNIAELAAWTSVSRVILNLSETITRS